MRFIQGNKTVREIYRETETHTQRERERERAREREREREAYTDRQSNTEKETDRHTDIKIGTKNASIILLAPPKHKSSSLSCFRKKKITLRSLLKSKRWGMSLYGAL